MSISFTRTRAQLAAMVLRKVGVLGNTGSADSADLDICYEAIDLRLKEMHRLGVFWRKVTSVPVSFSIATGINSAQAATNDIVFPIAMTVLDGTNDCPITLIGVTEYSEITDKTQTGLPTKALWKGSTEFLLHPIPINNSTLKLVYEKYADDTTAGAAPDVEVSMLRWMKDIVAYDIGDDFGVDETKMGRFMKECIIAERNIRHLAVQRKDPSVVAVDDWEGSIYRKPTDYGW